MFGSFEITSIRLCTPLRNPLRYAGYTVCTTVVDKGRIIFVKTHGVHEMANTSCVAAIYQGGGVTLLCLSGTDDGGISGTDDGGVVVWISDMVWSVGMSVDSIAN